MKKFTKINGLVAPMDQSNVDTDQIIPKQFLKSIKRSGFGPNLFDAWRYLDEGEPGMDNSTRPLNPDFVLNKPEFKGASILLARRNFGCGSSREHAPWALEDFGFQALIAPSYADIFYNNCFKNGILPVILDEEIVDRLFKEQQQFSAYHLDVDLEKQCVKTPSGETLPFEVDEFRKHCLLNGLDDIALTLQNESVIEDFEQQRMKDKAWLFAEMK